MCLLSATVYGQGVYFACDASYSSSTTYSKPDDSSGNRYMYFGCVLTGEFCKGTSDMKEPPKKAADSHFRYDSTVNDLNSPSMFVTYRDSQVYPYYLITFCTKRLLHNNTSTGSSTVTNSTSTSWCSVM